MRVVVIGGGVAGLAAAYHLRRQAAARGLDLRCRLVEGSRRLGGKVLTERRDGLVLEGGPDVVVDRKPAARELAVELGLGERIVAVPPGRAAILWRGRFAPVPRGAQALAPAVRDVLASPLFSWPGKLRLLAEPWVPPRRGAGDDDIGDESLADLVRRRLGREALERLAEPLLAHVHAARPEELSVAAVFPHLAEAERRAGSLRRGAAAHGAARRGPPAFWTLAGGLGELTDALAARLPADDVVLGDPVRELTRRPGGGFAVHLAGGRELAADAVVVATPAAVAARLLRGLAETPGDDLAGGLAALRPAPLAILHLAWERERVTRPPDGFGFFVPRAAGARLVLAGTWTSNKLPGRAPGDLFLARLFLGGAGGEDRLGAPDEELIAAARDLVEPLLGVHGAPRLARLVRWDDGYPQYDVGHRERVVAIEARLPAGVALAGAAYRGVGLPDCIASGRRAAERVLAEARRGRSAGPAKDAAAAPRRRLTVAAGPC